LRDAIIRKTDVNSSGIALTLTPAISAATVKMAQEEKITPKIAIIAALIIKRASITAADALVVVISKNLSIVNKYQVHYQLKKI